MGSQMLAKQNRGRGFIMFLIVGMVVTGSLNTILLKLQLRTKAVGIPGIMTHLYSHPWVQTLNMFLGECLCLVFYYITVWRAKKEREEQARLGSVVSDDNAINSAAEDDDEDGYARASRDESAGAPLLEGEADGTQSAKFNPFIIIIPACCDLLGTTLSGIGLLYAPASIWQMLRGSIIIFTGILSRVFLKRKLYGFHYAGMAIVTGGLVLVGMSGVLADNSSGAGGSILLGIVLVLAGMMLNAVQFVVEEKLLTHRNYPALQVVGWEGVWGSILTAAVALPITYAIHVHPCNNTCTMVTDPNCSNSCESGENIGGRYENAEDAWHQISNNGAILAYGIGAMFSIAGYNFFGLSVSKNVSSLARAVLDSLRTIVIWVTMLIVWSMTDSAHKLDDTDKKGEQWSKYSLLQVGGFLVLVFGSLVYGKAIRLPKLYYPPDSENTA